MPKPLVSVILSRTNGEACLRGQTLIDFETVVADARHSLAAGRNRAVEVAQGEYLAFLDAEQLWTPTKLEKQASMLTQLPDLNWCYCRSHAVETRVHSGDVLRPLLLNNFVPSGSVLIRRSIFEGCGGFDESSAYSPAEEWELWLRIAAEHPLGLVDEPLIHLVAGPLTSHQQTGMKQVIEAAVRRHPHRLKDVRSEALANICCLAGHANMRSGMADQARLNFEEALTHTPLRPDAYWRWVSSFLNLSRHVEGSEKTSSIENINRG